MPEFIYRRPPDPRDRGGHRLTRIMAVPIGEEWGAPFEERFGVRLVQGFGMTEINMVAYSDPADPADPGCAGRVLEEFFEVIVADPDTDEALPPDTVGEILVRPRQPFCFNVGYFKMDDKTVEAWRNLWFHTGDAGRFDAEGRLHFVDRLKDRIRRRGENISSYEIEQVLNNHPAVFESAAVGVKVAGAGGEEEIKAVLVAEPGATIDPAELIAPLWSAGRASPCPADVEIVDASTRPRRARCASSPCKAGRHHPATWDREAAGIELRRS
ncbi:MAG: AMP-binding protein [Acidimicrobiales bacterium]